MEEDLHNSPQLRYPVDSGDAKYVSGLSTILVATIQEAKDRISQIEYIFCSQLYPNFQLKSKANQKIHSEAIKASEDKWKKKEAELLLQIENLQHEKAKFVNVANGLPDSVYELQEKLKQKAQEVTEGKELKEKLLKLLESKDASIVTNDKILKEQEEKQTQLLEIQRSLEEKVVELKSKLMQKSKEVDEGMVLHNNLLQIIESKSSAIAKKAKQLKDSEEKTNILLGKLKSLEKKVDVLEEELRKSVDEVAKEKEKQESFLQKIEQQDLKMISNKQIVHEYEMERKVLRGKLENLEEDVNALSKELMKKCEEVEKGKILHEQLHEQINLYQSRNLKYEQQLEKIEIDKNHVNRFHSEHFESLTKENSSKELVLERKKRREIASAYKSLKSQYNFLCTRFGLTKENILVQNKLDGDNDTSWHHQSPLASFEFEKKITETSVVVGETNKQTNGTSFQEKSEDDKIIGIITSSSTPSAPINTKSEVLSGTKRSASCWRATRSRQYQGGLDPHDDFLNTPLENIKGNLNKVMKEEARYLPAPAPKDMNCDNPDEETQQMRPPKPSTRGYKYVEPIRKKSERENLKGIECNQCKKFYDAVLADNVDEGSNGNKRQFRCEHHDGVSRHRYRFPPPLTPEGFWNIGFESEM